MPRTINRRTTATRPKARKLDLDDVVRLMRSDQTVMILKTPSGLSVHRATDDDTVADLRRLQRASAVLTTAKDAALRESVAKTIASLATEDSSEIDRPL